jgi:hypothetical protein
MVWAYGRWADARLGPTSSTKEALSSSISILFWSLAHQSCSDRRMRTEKALGRCSSNNSPLPHFYQTTRLLHIIPSSDKRCCYFLFGNWFACILGVCFSLCIDMLHLVHILIDICVRVKSYSYRYIFINKWHFFKINFMNLL